MAGVPPGMKVKMNIPLEILVIERFFKKDKRDRYISFISSKKNRKKFIQTLPHLRDLNWDLFNEVSCFDPGLVGVDSGSCYVISEDASVDQTILSATDIDKFADSGQAFILVFGDARQIYYEGEPPFNRYISQCF